MRRSVCRVIGFLEHKIKSSSKPWVSVDFGAIQKLTGYSKRTVERAIATARDSMDNDLVFRTCFSSSNRKWQILCSTTERLNGLKISEPFSYDGKEKRIIKDHKQGQQINTHQLRLGPQKEFFGTEAPQEEEVEEVTEAPEDPNQLEFVWNSKKAPWNERLEDSKANGASLEEQKEVAKCYANFLGLKAIFSNRHFCQPPLLNKGFPKGKQRNGLRPASFNKSKLRGLTFHLLKSFKNQHYDNCKVVYSDQFAFSYCFDSLAAGYRKEDVLNCYREALIVRHADATDEGIRYVASSTISLAKELLKSKGKFWTTN